MPKKKYDASKLSTDPVYGPLAGTQEEHEAPKVAKAQIIQDTPIEGETPKEQRARLKKAVADGLRSYQGNKTGDRLDRIQMAFLPELYDFIRTMSKAEGITMTAFVNTIMAIEMERNGDKYRAIKAALEED